MQDPEICYSICFLGKCEIEECVNDELSKGPANFATFTKDQNIQETCSGIYILNLFHHVYLVLL